ncbi:TIGR04282 family arsenosugar biosynthesis glycosyltransferase [Candidatus Palauibacter sp.]|uniref:TIGR04282 family arsenosugar biosynthesis glycosyltransferase n=1 Tax=Candidatus Palauibacter sp. TaxID=3101350 RepID=UPI003C70355F
MWGGRDLDKVAERRLLVFGRLPEPRYVKTRLSPRLTPGACAALYEAFLDDAMRLAPRGANVELWVPVRPRAVERLEARYPAARVRLQPEGSLGDRLAMAFACAFREGTGRAVAIGSDHPTLPAEFVARAFRALTTRELVLGPTRDGGYYAIGLRRAVWPAAERLFADAPWSEAALCDWTRASAAELGLAPAELPTWYDVDRPEDLSRMEGDLLEGSATARAWARLGLARGAAPDQEGDL